MPITGIAELNFAVDDVAECTRFFEDFGLTKREASNDHAVLEVATGQRVNLYPMGDPRVPKSGLVGPGVHECVWALANEQDLRSLVDDLSRDHDVTIDDMGTAHFVTSFGQAIGLKVFQPRSFVATPSPANAPGIVNRLNAPRKWVSRALPKTINHLVWGFLDVNEAYKFYSERLGFRLSDVQKGVGLYIRAGRSTNHHNICLADASLTLFGFSGEFAFHHVNFGVVDVDEIMAGKAYLERRGYDTGGWGLGRHRISSEMFLYIKSPAGGEVEYGADCDQCDEHWRPRLWGAAFAAFTFVHDMPAWFKDNEPGWDVTYATPETSRHIRDEH